MNRRKSLKRGGGGLKRSALKPGDKPLQRKSGLKPGDKQLRADAAKTRAFVERGRANRKLREPLPDEIRQRVLIRCGFKCVMCPATTWLDPHHVLPVNKWPELELEEYNIVMLCRGCHDDHERGNTKVPRSRLPIQFLRFLYGHADREEHMRRHYADG